MSELSLIGCNPMVAVWSALHDLADSWRSSPAVSRQRQHLADPFIEGSDLSSPLRQPLNELSNYTFMTEPLMLHTSATSAMSQPMARRLDNVFESSAWASMLTDAELIESSFMLLLTYVRSRIPGYPMIPAPQLARDSWLTNRELGYRVPWLNEHYAWAMQQLATPGVAAGLEVEVRRHDERVSALVRALSKTPQWITYEEARNRLTALDRSALIAAKQELRLKMARIDDYEPELAYDRLNFRQHHTETVTESLEGAAYEFASAFAALESLINLVGVEIFGQMVMHEVPMLVTAYHEFSASETTIRLLADVPFIRPGSVLIAVGSPVEDAFQVRHISLFQSDERSGMELEGQILTGTAAAWL